MDHPPSTTETGLLLLIHRLHRTHRPLGRETIVPFAEIKLPDVASNYDRLVCALEEQTLIEGGPEAFTLTSKGQDAVDRVSRQHSLHAMFYDAYYEAVLHSDAHALFCERVYGRNLCQHGAADMEQLHVLLDELEVGAGMTVLDFGCGDGRIAEYLSDTVGAIVTGVDIAQHAISLAQKRTEAKRDCLGFYWASPGAQGAMFAPRTFDRVIAIDSLFFAPDQRAELATLLGYLKPGGKMGVFYLSMDEAGAEQTVLGVALEEVGVAYHVRDLSARNERHWQRKREALRELEPAFVEEGSTFLYKNRLVECDGAERFRRYLFIITC